MGKFKDLTGKVFGRLTVIGRDLSRKGGTYWLCKCSCGNVKSVRVNSLTGGAVKSCGCLRNEKVTVTNTRHGQYQNSVYRVWAHMKARCLNPNDKSYPRYGGRGITICAEWLDFQTFFDYVSRLEHFGEEGYSLDRIDNSKGYEVGNVRWADKKTQQSNTRRNVYLEYKGEFMTMAEAARLSGIDKSTLLYRVKAGDTGERLFRPVRKRVNNENETSAKTPS